MAMTKAIAQLIRQILEDHAAGLSDSDAVTDTNRFMTKRWKAGKEYSAGERIVYHDTVYKVLQAHTSEEGVPPDNNPLFSYIDENGKTVLQGKGSADNPFDIVYGITLIQNAYYQANGVRYVYMGEANKTYEGEVLIEDNGFIEF